MELTYEFGRYGEDEFTIDVDSEDYLYELKKDPKEVEELVKEVYEDNKRLQDMGKEYGINKVEDIDVTTDDGREYCYDALYEIDDDTLKEYRKDDLMFYYEEYAKEQYEDSKIDPYTYNGVSPRDFY